MGTDIYVVGEKKFKGIWTKINIESIFDGRNYNLFAFLAGIRNYSDIDPIVEPRGLPDDFNDNGICGPKLGEMICQSWLTVQELASYDYNKEVEDRRYTRAIRDILNHGGCTAGGGQGRKMTMREFLGNIDEIIKALEKAGVERIVFGFDC